jgi:hypothetical protein
MEEPCGSFRGCFSEFSKSGYRLPWQSTARSITIWPWTHKSSAPIDAWLDREMSLSTYLEMHREFVDYCSHGSMGVRVGLAADF